MAEVWGLQQPRRAAGQGAPEDAPEAAGNRGGRRKLSPRAVRAGHQGIVWLHASAIIVWVFVSVVFAALLAAGKAVPAAVVLAGAAAACGHGLFLATHLYLAAYARKRAAAAASGEAPVEG